MSLHFRFHYTINWTLHYKYVEQHIISIFFAIGCLMFAIFRYLYRRNKKGITAKLDDDLLKFYCNEDTFLMQVRNLTCFRAFVANWRIDGWTWDASFCRWLPSSWKVRRGRRVLCTTSPCASSPSERCSSWSRVRIWEVFFQRGYNQWGWYCLLNPTCLSKIYKLCCKATINLKHIICLCFGSH